MTEASNFISFLLMIFEIVVVNISTENLSA